MSESSMDTEALEADARARVGEWHEDGTGRENVDGSPSTCDSGYNRGYDAGYLVGLKHGTPPVRVPRWDLDPIVLRHGLLGGRCGNCGEECRHVELTADRAGAPRD